MSHNMKTRTLTKIALVAVLAFAAVPAAYGQTMCTMDAMQCPDGSWTGRSGPNCEFVCPGQTGGGSPGYDGNSSSKPTYPTTPAPTGAAPDAPVSDQDFVPPSSNGQVDIVQSDNEPDVAEDMNLSTNEEQSGLGGYFKSILGSITSFIGGLLGW